MESLTLTGLARYDETTTRAAMVFSDSDYIRMLLSALRKERNALVHTDARLEAAETSMYQLKSVVDGLLRFWFGAARRLRSEAEVQMFLQLPPAALTLKRRKTVLDAAIRYRRG